MKRILLVLIPFYGLAQNDTIYKKDGKLIPCTITLSNESTTFYKDKKGYGDEVKNEKIEWYSLAGKRKAAYDPALISYKAFKIDTGRNELGQFKMSKVFEYTDTSLTKAKLYDRVKEFIYKTYVSGNDVKLYEDKELGKFFCRAITKHTDYYRKMDGFHWADNCDGGYFMYNMTIYSKNQKVKIVIDEITHKAGKCPYDSRDGSDFGDGFPTRWQRTETAYNSKQYQLMKAQAFKEFVLILDYLDKINKSTKNEGDF